MKKWLFIAFPITIALAVVITWFTSLYVFERPIFDESVEQKSMLSTSLGEQREYLIHLPRSYKSKPNKRYPVIYVLDGSSQDMHTAASASLMANIGVIPEVIVVGIPNIDGKGRQRDYTPPGMRQDIDEKNSHEGSADKFLAFIRNELVPEIDKSYRTTPSRTLAGNSRGGLFVIYAITKEPTLFDAYIANSPALWRDNDEMVRRFNRFLKEDGAIERSLFLSLGSDENDKMKAAFERIVAALQQHAPATLRWHSQLTIGGTHGNNAELSTPVALRWAFDSNWKPGGMISGSSP